MRTYERNTVTVDQCTDCRGIFLDRGELERLIDAEATWGEQREPTPRRDDYPREDYRREDNRRDDYPREDSRREDYRRDERRPYPPKKRRKSFFEDLFD